jgi:hypothetical protein
MTYKGKQRILSVILLIVLSGTVASSVSLVEMRITSVDAQSICVLFPNASNCGPADAADEAADQQEDAADEQGDAADEAADESDEPGADEAADQQEDAADEQADAADEAGDGAD